MSEADSAFALEAALDEREFQKIIAVELARSLGEGPQHFHQDEVSKVLYAFISQIPAVINWCDSRDERDGLPMGTCRNIMVATLSEMQRKMEADFMSLCDKYSKQIPYRRLVNQIAILAAQQLVETICTD